MLSDEELLHLARTIPWCPQPGPQTQAFHSDADVLLYGGAAGGGKTALSCGMAITAHRQTLFIRREAKQLGGVLDEVGEIIDPQRAGYSGQTNEWKIPPWDGNQRKIVFGSIPNMGDETRYQGRPRDLLVVDEAANCIESQIFFLMGWVRTTLKGQRCRTILCSNPPTSAEGEWLIRWFAPWLDPSHKNPAEPGELRWYAVIDQEHIEVESGTPFMHNGEQVIPQSRTFIPAKVQDNKYLIETGYVATLQALPEPLRSQMLYGDFLAGREDDEYQVIPSDWVSQAMARWQERPIDQQRITSVGVDPSRGGRDDSIIAPREDWYYHKLITMPGHQAKDGDAVGQKVLEVAGLSLAPIHIDSIGIGAAVVDSLNRHIPHRVVPMNAAEKAGKVKDQSGVMHFTNKRAEWWWRFRELLNPANGKRVALPPDQQLKAELCAPRYNLTGSGIQIESKKDLVKRLGRSTDRADAVIMAAERTPLMHVAGQIRPRFQVKGALHSQKTRRQ